MAAKLKMVQAENPTRRVAFIDIGANIGVYTLSMASMGFRTYAFEPMT